MSTQREVLSRSSYFVALLAIISITTGCSSIFKEKEVKEPTIIDTASLSQEEAKRALTTGTSNWFYGQGLGDTTVKVAGSILFPPYAVYVLGNAAVEMAGYEGFYVTNALPEPYREGTVGLYDTVTSVPGRVASTLSGTEFKSPDRIATNGGFWGLTNSSNTTVASVKSSPFENYQYMDENEIHEDPDNSLAFRNDLYGNNRSGS